MLRTHSVTSAAALPAAASARELVPHRLHLRLEVIERAEQ